MNEDEAGRARRMSDREESAIIRNEVQESCIKQGASFNRASGFLGNDRLNTKSSIISTVHQLNS
jgi:hypothetical protein